RDDSRAIQRVNGSANQPARGVARQLGIGVERDDIAHPSEERGVASLSDETRVLSAAQQAVQFAQLAAFSFPTHPFVLTGIPTATTMKQMEARPVVAVASVESFNSRQRA